MYSIIFRTTFKSSTDFEIFVKTLVWCWISWFLYIFHNPKISNPTVLGGKIKHLKVGLLWVSVLMSQTFTTYTRMCCICKQNVWKVCILYYTDRWPW